MIFHQYFILKLSGKQSDYSVEHCSAPVCGLAHKLGWLVIAVLSTTLIFMSGAGAAIQMNQLYEAETVVEGQGISERRRAFQDMLGEMVVRISGSREALSFPTIIDALKKPDRFVQQYRYFQKTPEKELTFGQATEQKAGQAEGQVGELIPGPVPDPITILWIRTEKKTIIDLLQKSGLPVWRDIRPATLVWLAVDVDGQRYLLGNDNENPIREQISQHANRRGVPLLFPLMDLEDQQKISFTDIWGGFSGAIHDASERYATEATLVGKILQDRDGSWSVRWHLYDTQGELQWQYSSEQVQEILGVGIDGLADRLGGLHSVLEGDQLNTRIMLNVSGVSSLKDYAHVQQYLNTISVISEKRLVQLKDDQLQFRLELKGESSDLTQAFALKNVLAPDLVASPQSVSEQGALQKSLQGQDLQEQKRQEQLLQEQLLREERSPGQGKGLPQQTDGQGIGQSDVPVENRSTSTLPESGNIKTLMPTELYYRLRP